MADRTKIIAIAHVIPGLENVWLQYMRAFDTKYPGCHFEIVRDAPDKTMQEIVREMQVHPPLPVQEIIKREPSHSRDRLRALTDSDRDLIAEALQPQIGGVDARRLVDLLIEIAISKNV
jgi:hypothetical protein